MARPDTDGRITPIPTGTRRCPICGKPAAARSRPFCSARCADIDLGRWLKGNYRVETEEPSGNGSEDDANPQGK
jgi:uncharacterized protein